MGGGESGDGTHNKPALFTTATKPSKNSHVLTVTVHHETTKVYKASLKASRPPPLSGRQQEGMNPPQASRVSGRLSRFVEEWKRIMNEPCVLIMVNQQSGVQTSFYLLKVKVCCL